VAARSDGIGMGIGVIRYWWARFVCWLNADDLEDGGIPDACCGEPRPADPIMWERWEAEHERRHDADAEDELARRTW
jgi:hypothetical protein